MCIRMRFSAKEEKAREGDERIGLDFSSYCVRPCAQPFKCMISFFVHGTENAMCASNLLAPECHIRSCLLDIWRAKSERK